MKNAKTIAQHRAIIVIVVAFILLGAVYNITTPIFETPDETSHYLYVQYLADGNGLPPLRFASDDVGQGEMHQPPLYYWLGSLIVRSLGTSSSENAFERNPYATLGDPGTIGNKNAIIHSPKESWPYTDVALAVHCVRMMSTLFFAAVVLLTYLIALQVVPHRKIVAIGSAALVAFNPQFLFIGAGISNDTLVTLLSALSLYMAVRIASGQTRTFRTPILMGLFTGLAALSKVNASMVALLVPAAYLILYASKTQRNLWRDLIRPVGIAALIAIAVGGWWYIRNAVLYNDPAGMGVMNDIFDMHTQNLSIFATLRYMIETHTSYWGVFGWLNITTDEAYYVFVRAFTLVGIVGLAIAGVWLAWRRQSMEKRNWRGALMVVSWVLLMLLAFGYFTQTVARQQGRLLFPAAPAIGLLLIVGVLAWIPRRYETLSVVAISIAFFFISAISPIRYIRPAYQQPTIVTLDQTPTEISPLNIAFDDSMFLLGYDMPQNTVAAGDVLPIRLYWVCTDRINRDLTVSIKAFGTDDQVLGTIDSFPGGGNYVTSQWIPGQVIFDDYFMPIQENLELPTAAPIRVGVYDRETLEHLDVTSADGTNLGDSVQIARARLIPEEESQTEPQYIADENYANAIALTGYDFASIPVENTWELTVHWQALAEIDQDYTVFVHILDPSEELVAQLDEQPLQANYPTSFWEPGELILDTHQLPVPDDFADGYYTIRVGLYLLETGERLTIADNPAYSYADLGPVLLRKQ